jgi:hypothetical protein
MATEKSDIRGWLERGKKEGATHLIVVCDTWDYEDYPVLVSPKQDVREVESEHNKDMQKVMEVYNLSMDWDTQLNQFRSFNY